MADLTETSTPTTTAGPDGPTDSPADFSSNKPNGNRDRQQKGKRKRGNNRPLQHGARNKGRDMGRGEYK